jgi:hypothetical protein
MFGGTNAGQFFWHDAGPIADESSAMIAADHWVAARNR